MARVQSHCHPDFQPPENTRLMGKSFDDAEEKWVKVCVDGLLWIPTKEGPQMLIFKRKILPWPDWWRVGARFEKTRLSKQEALVLILKKLLGITLDVSRIPSRLACDDVPHFAENNSCISASVFIVEITLCELEIILQHIPNDTFSEVKLLPPEEVADPASGYHPILQGDAAELVAHLRDLGYGKSWMRRSVYAFGKWLMKLSS